MLPHNVCNVEIVKTHQKHINNNTATNIEYIKQITQQYAHCDVTRRSSGTDSDKPPLHVYVYEEGSCHSRYLYSASLRRSLNTVVFCVCLWEIINDPYKILITN